MSAKRLVTGSCGLVGHGLTGRLIRQRFETVGLDLLRDRPSLGDVRESKDVCAFARAAAGNGEMHLEGSENTFDFAHMDDAAGGLGKLADNFQRRATARPSVCCVTVTQTMLGEFADLAVELSGGGGSMRHASSQLTTSNKGLTNVRHKGNDSEIACQSEQGNC